MKIRAKILSARKMAIFGMMIPWILTLPGAAALIVLTGIGHLSVYRGWEALLYGWDPYRVAPSAGLMYLALLIVSVLAHEAGHLAAAAYRGDLSAGMYIELHPKGLTFMTSCGSRCTSSGDGQRPVLDLVGVFSQMLFASSLGILFFSKGCSLIPPAVLLIDMAALASLLPVPGTDGYRFLLKSRLRRNIRGKRPGSSPDPTGIEGAGRRPIWSFSPCAVIVLGLVVIYWASSLGLLAAAAHQWVEGFPARIAAGNCGVIDVAGYMILLLPVLQYAHWSIGSMPGAFRSIRRL